MLLCARQAQVIAHEQSHLAAGDPQLCDARVLDAGHDVASYGETLTQRRSALGAHHRTTRAGDTYLVKFEKGSVIVRMNMKEDKIAGLLLQPL